MDEFNNEELKAYYRMKDKLAGKFKADKKYGFDLDLDSFALRCKDLKTQVYGLVMQNYLAHLLGFKITPSSEDLGDFSTNLKHDIEFKCSFIDINAENINVKQIRYWQDLNYYYIFTVDFTDYDNIIYKHYELTKDEMLLECLVMKARAVANVKNKNDDGENRALGFSIKVGSKHYDRWEDKYLNKKVSIKQLSNECLAKLKTEKDREDLINYQAKLIADMQAKIKELELNQAKPIIEEKEEINNDYDKRDDILVSFEHFNRQMSERYYSRSIY